MIGHGFHQVHIVPHDHTLVGQTVVTSDAAVQQVTARDRRYGAEPIAVLELIRLKQIGVALHNYQESRGTLPGADMVFNVTELSVPASTPLPALHSSVSRGGNSRGRRPCRQVAGFPADRGSVS